MPYKDQEVRREKARIQSRLYYNNHREAMQVKNRRWSSENKERHRSLNILNRRKALGIKNPSSTVHFGSCEIPGCPYIGKLREDHDPSTGFVRGHICPKHNRDMHVVDHAEVLLSCLKWRKEHGQRNA